MTEQKKQEITDAAQMALDMRKAGASWNLVAKEVNKQGFTNSYGKPYTPSGICTHALKLMRGQISGNDCSKRLEQVLSMQSVDQQTKDNLLKSYIKGEL